MNAEAIKPFLDVIGDMVTEKPTHFLGHNVEGAFLILTLRDGKQLRAAVTTINTDLADCAVAMDALLGVVMQDSLRVAVEKEPSCGERVN